MLKIRIIFNYIQLTRHDINIVTSELFLSLKNLVI